MSLFGNYNTPGRGVLKAPQEKKGIFKFFEVYGRHMWKLMELNLLYFVFCIPMTLMVILMLMTSNPIWLLLAIPSVLVGPATAAMTKVCRNYSQERNAFLLHDFWDSFKKNFKQGTIMGAILGRAELNDIHSVCYLHKLSYRILHDALLHLSYDKLH